MNHSAEESGVQNPTTCSLFDSAGRSRIPKRMPIAFVRIRCCEARPSPTPGKSPCRITETCVGAWRISSSRPFRPGPMNIRRGELVVVISSCATPAIHERCKARWCCRKAANAHNARVRAKTSIARVRLLIGNDLARVHFSFKPPPRNSRLPPFEFLGSSQ